MFLSKLKWIFYNHIGNKIKTYLNNILIFFYIIHKQNNLFILTPSSHECFKI